MKNILLDLDGTLTDPVVGITRSIQHAMMRLGLKVPETRKLRWCIGPSLVESFNKLLGEHGLMRHEAVRFYRERFSTVGLYENRVYPGVPELLERLMEDGYALYLATSKPTVFARRILEHFELAVFFTAVHGSELSGRRGDKQELLAHILEQHELDAGECLMVGDRQYDVIGAHACGLPCVGSLYGYGTRRELEKAGAEALIAAPLELLDCLQQLKRGYGYADCNI
jgi:phosphoglycolate phosphatase